jgi:manganese/zinc/iron transport system substrate-binding protein
MSCRSVICALLLSCAALLHAGCERPQGPKASGPPRVVATTTMIGDLVTAIAGDKVQLFVMMPPGSDPHGYKPTPADMVEVKRADLVFYNGLHLEGKMVDLFEVELKATSFPVVRDVPRENLIAVVQDGTTTFDPHVWFDPELWALACRTVERELSRVDPLNAAYYSENAGKKIASIRTLHEQLRELVNTVPRERRALVTSHDAFNYLGRAFDMDVRGLQGISTESEAGLVRMNAAVDFVISRKIPAIFIESSVSPKTIERVAADAKSRNWDVKIGGELYSDAMGKPGERPGYAVETYEGMLKYNIHTIVEALK